MISTRVVVCASLVLVGASAVANADLVIDNWSVNQGPMVDFDFSGNTVPGSMLGGQRKMYLSNVSGKGTTTASVSGNALRITKTPDAYPDVSQIWDGGVNQVGLGGVDITQGGLNDRLRMTVITNGRASVAVYISEKIGARSLGYFNFFGPASGTFDLLLSSIPSDGAGPKADLTKVGAIYFDIQMDANPGAATDFVMGDFVVAPAPGALALAGFAGALGLRRRR